MKEESSDESTIISSQTSTLTRSQGKGDHRVPTETEYLESENGEVVECEKLAKEVTEFYSFCP